MPAAPRDRHPCAPARLKGRDWFPAVNSGTCRSRLPKRSRGRTMLRQIVVEAETPGDSRTMFRLRIDANLIAEDLTTAQAHLLVGEILERIALPKPLPTLPSDDAEQPSSDSAAPPLGRRWTGIDRLSQAMRAVFTALPLAGLVGVLRHLAGARSDGIMSLTRSFAFLSRSKVARAASWMNARSAMVGLSATRPNRGDRPHL